MKKSLRAGVVGAVLCAVTLTAFPLTGGVAAYSLSRYATSNASRVGQSNAHALGSTVNVGAIGLYAGFNASASGKTPEVLQAWADTMNAEGGLDGHRVKMFTEDAAQGEEPGLGDIKTLINQDHVIAIIDQDESPDDATWLPYAKQHNVPVIVAGAAYISPMSDTDAFPVVGDAALVIYQVLAVAKSLGPNFAFDYCTELPACAAYGQLVKAVGADLGESVPVETGASSSAPDYTALCQDLSGQVESWSMFFPAETEQTITDQCVSQGIKVPQLLLAVSAAPYWKTDSAFYGDTVLDQSAPYFADLTPGQKAYRNALKKYAPSILGATQDTTITVWAWDAAQLIAAAAKNAGTTLTRASLTSGLYDIKDNTLGGLTQPLTFVKNRPTWLPCGFTWKIGPTGQFEAGGKYEHLVCAPTKLFNTINQFIEKAAG